MPRVAADVRRGELVDATIRVALADGLESASVRRIAEEAGVSLGTVHYCFGSKRALLEAVVDHVIAAEQDINFTTDRDDLSLEEAARAGLRAYWTQLGADRNRQRLVYELITHLVRQEDPGPELARKIIQSACATIQRFFEANASQMAQAKLSVSLETLAEMALVITDGVAISWIAQNDDEKALRQLDLFSELFAHWLDRAHLDM